MPKTLSFREGLEAITKLALELADQIPTPIILIDGRAGSGKSTFAQKLRDSVFQRGEASPTLLSMDDLYPGWKGLKEGSTYLMKNILQPLSQGRKASWQSWDWNANSRGREGEPGNGWREFSGANIFIIEGCGSVSRESQEVAHLTCWLEASHADRLQRLRNRDESKFDSFWPGWESQHDEVLSAWNALDRADYIILNSGNQQLPSDSYR